MSFAKRPTIAAEPAKPTAVSLKPVAPVVKSLLDDPDAISPVGLIFRLTGGLIAAFALVTAVALWLEPDEWWEDDSSLAQPFYAGLGGWEPPLDLVRLLFAVML